MMDTKPKGQIRVHVVDTKVFGHPTRAAIYFAGMAQEIRDYGIIVLPIKATNQTSAIFVFRHDFDTTDPDFQDLLEHFISESDYRDRRIVPSGLMYSGRDLWCDPDIQKFATLIAHKYPILYSEQGNPLHESTLQWLAFAEACAAGATVELFKVESGHLERLRDEVKVSYAMKPPTRKIRSELKAYMKSLGFSSAALESVGVKTAS